MIREFWQVYYNIVLTVRRKLNLKLKASGNRLRAWRINPRCHRCGVYTTLDKDILLGSSCILKSVATGMPKVVFCNNCAHKISYANNCKLPKIPLKQRLMMWKRDPKCHWCGIPTVIYPYENGQKHPDDEATIDHLRSRNDPTRQDPICGKEYRRVLACFKCNKERNDLEQSQISIDKLHESSGRS